MTEAALGSVIWGCLAIGRGVGHGWDEGGEGFPVETAILLGFKR